MDLAAQITFLEEIYDLDQDSRFAIPESEQEKIALSQRIFEQDAKNLAAMLDYLERFGWPLLSRHGAKAVDAAYLVIQHSNLDIMQKYFPILAERVAAGEALKTNAAMMQDRLLMWQEKPQIYGSQARALPGRSGFVIWPVENVDGVNERRKEVGFFASMEDNAKGMDAVYDPSLTVADFPKIDW